jgi:hypothetical protein
VIAMQLRRPTTLLLATLAAASLHACSDSNSLPRDGETPADTGRPPTDAGADTTVEPDTAVEPDGADDSGSEDTTPTDTEPADTGADSEPADTGADSEPADTGADSEPADTGADSEPVDTGADSGGEPPVESPFTGTILLGRPEPTRAELSLVATEAVEAWVEYGTAAGDFSRATPPTNLAPNLAHVVALTGLAADQRVTYRVRWRRPSDTAAAAHPARTFSTPRSAGQTFTFTVQADSHLDENSVLEQYQRTLDNIAADQGDFHIDLGDTFMCEKHSEPLSGVVARAPDEATVVSRYLYERGHFDRITQQTALFLVNGNHEGELGYLRTPDGANVADWAANAREAFFLNPLPGSFYGGDPASDPVVGQRAAWYSWQWGDALFVVLDPFWNTLGRVSRDPWAITLGQAQFEWLEATLEASTARFKFVFIHNLVGGLDGAMRGGVEAAGLYEWGGRELDGTDAFATRRPGWSMPIHALLATHGVTAVFHGHDHLYAHQQLDGVHYQEVPQPSARNNNSGANLAATYHYDSGTIASSSGHLRVTVAPRLVSVDYVRSWLPAAEGATRINREITDHWEVAAP